MYLPKTCFVGRIIIRTDGLAGLDWRTPCRVPPEEMLPFDPPMYFCVRHYDAVAEGLYDILDAAGLIDHDVVAGPMDEFDAIMGRLRSTL